MSIFDFFRHIHTITADEARKKLENAKPDSLQLLDVRQPKEYDQRHIPGTILIPLRELPDKMDLLDPNKPIIVYCAVGGRSRAAAGTLEKAGFKHVYNMAGGIRAWKGEIQKGQQ